MPALMLDSKLLRLFDTAGIDSCLTRDGGGARTPIAEGGGGGGGAGTPVRHIYIYRSLVYRTLPLSPMGGGGGGGGGGGPAPFGDDVA